MAYLDTESGFSVPASARPSIPPLPHATGFSALEWTVVLLARNDDLRSLRAPSRLSRALGSVLGLSTKSTLADPRLEALRRIAVLVWRRGAAVPAAEIDRFLRTGFERAQLDILLRSVGSAA